MKQLYVETNYYYDGSIKNSYLIDERGYIKAVFWYDQPSIWFWYWAIKKHLKDIWYATK